MRLLPAAVAATGVALLVSVSVAPASAASAARNGKCENGEFCLYWNYGKFGSVSDFASSVSNYGASQPDCYEFRTPDMNGYGECVKNNAMSAWNRTSRTVRVYFNSNYGGKYDTAKAGDAIELEKTSRDNASHKFL